MKRLYPRMFQVAAVLIGITLLSGCPGGSPQHVAWFVNTTTGFTFNKFTYDVDPVKTVTLDPPLTPGSAQPFYFDDEFRSSVKWVGLQTTGGGVAMINPGTFGFGGTDFVVASPVLTSYAFNWVKGTV